MAKKTPVKRAGSDSRVSSGNRRRPPVKRAVKKTKFHAGTLIATLVTLFMFIYIGGVVYNYINRQTIATVEIKNDVIDTQKGTVYGVIIRHEEVLHSNGEGEVSFILNDKERVKKGTAVLQIRNTANVDYIEKNLMGINETLNDQQNRRSDLSLFYSDAIKINSQIKETVEKSIYKLVGAGTSDIYSIKEAIQKNITLRNQMLLSEDKGSVKDYIEEKTYFENELSKYVKTVESMHSGVLSYYYDKLESVFTIDAMEGLTKEQVSMKPAEIINSSRKLVGVDEPVCRIVTENEWYIAAYVDNEYADGLEKGDVKKLYILKNEVYETVETTVHYTKKGESQTYMIFKSTKNIIDFMDLRNVSFKLIDSAHKGLKVPNTAMVYRTFLRIPNGFVKNGAILRQSETGNEKIDVTVKSGAKSEEGYTYILFDFSKFSMGDVFVAESEEANTYNLQETDIISLRGVYKANSQTAKFYVIDDEDIVSAGGYSILDPQKNSGLNPHDRIVVDGTNIVENQIIN